MSVAGDSVLLQNHFGSLYTMADYTSSAHNLYMTTSVKASPKLNLTGSVNYNMSKGELEQVAMPEVTSEVSSILNHQDFTFGEMHEYSMLEYGYLQLGFGMVYKLAPRFSISADVDYADLSDETGYVYGVESGSYLMLRTGFQVDF